MSHIKNDSKRSHVNRLAMMVFCLLCFACGQTRVKVPDPQHDLIPPLITVDNNGSPVTDTVPAGNFNSNASVTQVKVTKSSGGKCEVPQLFVIGNATLGDANTPGGVKDFQITITKGDDKSPMYNVVVSQKMAADGTAENTLVIGGTNGVNGDLLMLTFGSNSCPLDQKFHVTAKSSNFHGVTTTMDYDIVSTGITAGGSGCPCG